MRLSELRRDSGEGRTLRCRKRLACQPKIETEQSYGITTLGIFCGRYEKSRSHSWLSRQISPTEIANCDTFDQDNADILRKNGLRGVGTIRLFEWRVRAGAEDGTTGRTTEQTTESKNKERVLEAFDTLFNKAITFRSSLHFRKWIRCQNAASTPTMRRSFGENGEASAGTQRGLGKRNKRGN